MKIHRPLRNETVTSTSRSTAFLMTSNEIHRFDDIPNLGEDGRRKLIDKKSKKPGHGEQPSTALREWPRDARTVYLTFPSLLYMHLFSFQPLAAFSAIFQQRVPASTYIRVREARAWSPLSIYCGATEAVEREREKEREQKVEARGWQSEKEGKARAKGRVARHGTAAGRVRRKSAATVAPSSTHPVWIGLFLRPGLSTWSTRVRRGSRPWARTMARPSGGPRTCAYSRAVSFLSNKLGGSTGEWTGNRRVCCYEKGCCLNKGSKPRRRAFEKS